jgi:hypothetical protein
MDTSQQDVAAGQPRRSSTKKWVLIILVVLATLSVAGMALCGGVIYLVFGAMKSSTPYVMALEQLRQDPQVIERLGKPLEDITWFPTGNLRVENDRGEANLNFTVAGPKGQAQVGTMARCVGGSWGLVTLDVIYADGQRCSVKTDTAPAAAADEAPRWSPGK